MRHCTITWIALGVLATAMGCVTSPSDTVAYRPSESLNLSGYASKAGEIVQVQAMDYCASSWRPIAAFTGSTTPTTFNGDTLYAWSGSFVFSTVPGWECYWEWANGGFAKHAQLRMQEQSGGNLLTTFDPSGLACVVDKMSQGTGWLVAGNQCRGSSSPLIHLYWNQVR